MTTLVDAKWAALRAQLFTGAMSDMTLQWLQASGATSPSIPDAWREMLDALLTVTTGQRNDDWFALLLAEGYYGSLNDMEKAFWEAGGVLPLAPVTPPPTPPGGLTMTEGWSQTGFNEFTWENDSVSITNSPISFLGGQLVEGQSYQMDFELVTVDSITPSDPNARVDARLGGSTKSTTSAALTYPIVFSNVEVMGSNVGQGLLFQTYTNLTLQTVVLKNVTLVEVP